MINLFFCSLISNIINELTYLIKYSKTKPVYCLGINKIYLYMFNTVSVNNGVRSNFLNVVVTMIRDT